MSGRGILNSSDVSFRRYDASTARSIRATVEAVYVGSYVEAIASGHSFDSVEAFMSRFDAYADQGDFDVVIAYCGDEPIGQAWGWPLSAKSQWWAGISHEPEPGFTCEDGQRTFALSEIMVAAAWSGKGIAHALHDTLLSARLERRATLLVEPENVMARRAYLHWGWLRVAKLRPDWPDAPLFEVFIRDLHQAEPAVSGDGGRDASAE